MHDEFLLIIGQPTVPMSFVVKFSELHEVIENADSQR